jgi:diguanylate cyclase (GGDEF)-like protein/putative nucleotidyltransferase with HDIG domain
MTAVPRARIGVALGAALFMIVYAVAYLATEDETTRANITTILTAITACGSLAGALWALRRSVPSNRGVWISMTVSTVSFSTAYAYRSVYVIENGVYPSSGSIEDIAFVIGFLALIPAVMLMSQPRQGVRLTHLRQALDLTSIALALLAGLALILLVPLRLVGADTGLGASVAFGIYAALSATLVVYLLAFKHTRWTSAEALILAGLASGALAVLAIIIALDLYQPTTMYSAIPNSLLTAGFLFFGAAGVHAATRRRVFSSFTTPTILMPAWTGHASTAVALVGVPWLIIAAGQAEELFSRVLLTTIAVILAVSVAGRNIVVSAENRQLAERAVHDPLTGLLNEKEYHTRVSEEMAKTDQEGTDTCVCELLIDRQDERIRRRGFAKSDAVIKAIARRIESVAGLESAFRIGSDRFALLLADTNAVEAYEICSRTAQAARDVDEDAVTFSVGVASARLTSSDPGTLISFASGAAYWASTTGGDRIVLFDPEVVKATDSKSHIASIEEQSHNRLLEALAAAVDARDPYTRHHSLGVARLVEGFAEHLQLHPERIEMLRNAALMHDLGKIGIADSVLMKPGQLTEAEYEIIRTHSELGARILSSGSSSEMVSWVRAHHERWDGRGYPDGLSGEGIPYEARLLTICDAYDAMTSDRPYRQGLTLTEAVEELKACAGTQFDPNLVEPFLEGLFKMWPETGDLGHRSGRGTRGKGRETVKGATPSL